jgi:hypothetical protein
MWAAMRYKTLVTLGYTLLALSLCACGPSEAEMHQVILTAYEDMWATDFLGPRRRDDENHIEKVCKPLDQLAEAEFVGKRPIDSKGPTRLLFHAIMDLTDACEGFRLAQSSWDQSLESPDRREEIWNYDTIGAHLSRYDVCQNLRAYGLTLDYGSAP